jgi:hypothetical protein
MATTKCHGNFVPNRIGFVDVFQEEASRTSPAAVAALIRASARRFTLAAPQALSASGDRPAGRVGHDSEWMSITDSSSGDARKMLRST